MRLRCALLEGAEIVSEEFTKMEEMAKADFLLPIKMGKIFCIQKHNVSGSYDDLDGLVPGAGTTFALGSTREINQEDV
jgi:hypothetical protein